MDGATKFVKGDAIAGILILAVNVIGGLVIGVMQHGLALSDAAAIYITLAIGDGLVAQIPSLLLSIATAIIVTRESGGNDLAELLVKQVGMRKAWWPVAGILGLIGIMPGMPNLLFLTAAAGSAAVAYYAAREKDEDSEEKISSGAQFENAAAADESEDPVTIEDVA